MPSFRKSLARVQTKAKSVFRRTDRSPDHQSQAQSAESLPSAITRNDASIRLKNADPPPPRQSLPASLHDGMPMPVHEPQTQDTKILAPGVAAKPSQFVGINPNSSQQSFSTTIAPNPWEAWTLDQDFLHQVYVWNANHPENTVDRIFTKISTAIEQHQVLLELVPDGPIPIRGFVKALAHIVKLGTTMAEAKVAALQFAQGVLQWVEKLAAALGGGGSGRFIASAWDNLADIRKLIENVCIWAHRMLNVGLIERVSVNERILEFRKEFTQAVERFGVISNINLGIGQDHIHQRLDNLDTHINQKFQILQDRLPQRQQTLPDATFLVQNKIPCDPGTRKQVLEEIMKWISDIAEGSPCFFWLSGDPGVGKSAVTASIAQECKRRKILWAQFFINRNDASTIDPQLYFPTIVKQMSEHKPAVGYAVESILKEQPDLMKDDISIQATDLFLKAVQVASESTPGQPIAIVIDALDETDLKRLKVTAEIFSRILVDLPNNVKVFISSRVENVIRDNFGRHPRAKNIHLSARTSVADVTQFLEAKVYEIMAEYHIDWSHWGHQRMRKLCSQASGLFIWAVTAIAYLRTQIEDFGKECLDVVLDELNAHGMDDINVLYMAILKRTYRRETSPWQTQCFQRIIGAILVQRSPLPIEDLQGLLDLRNPTSATPVDVEHLVRRLRTVLVPGVGEINGRTVPRVHKSFVDFITSSVAQEFRVDIAASHGELALQCIDRLICLWRGDNWPRQLRYATSHWSSHLTCIFGVPVELEETEDDTTSDDEKSLLSISKDPGASVSLDPIQTGKLPSQGHLSSISISPDGSRVVYAKEESVYLKDIETGDFVQGPFNGHTDLVRSATFSPDGRLILSASDDKTICIWDAETGKLVRALTGHTKYVLAATFSPDGRRIVSGSQGTDGTVRIWDAETGQVLHIMSGHTSSIYSAVFSPDARHVVSSGSLDKTVRVWDTTTGEAVHILQHDNTEFIVLSAVFSPDGKNILSTSSDRTINIWDAETGERLFAGSTSGNPLAFTDSGKTPYIETPSPTSNANPKDPKTPSLSPVFRVGQDGLAAGISGAWVYANPRGGGFTMSTHLGQPIMTFHFLG